MATRGDSKQGLVIGLVFAIILNCIFALMAYLNWQEAVDLESQRQRIAIERDTARANLNKERFLRSLYKFLAGHEDVTSKDQDQNDGMILSGNKAQFSQSKVAGETPLLQAEIAKIKEIAEKKGNFKSLEWDDDKNDFRPSYLARIRILEDVVADLRKNLDEKDNLLKDAEKRRDDALAELAKEKEKFDTKLKELSDQLVKKPVLDADEFKKSIKMLLEEQGAQIEKLTKQKMDLADEYDQKVKALENRLALELEDRKKLEERMGLVLDRLRESDWNGAVAEARRFEGKLAPINRLYYDVPRGKVVSVDRSGETVYVNIGSADRVKPQLTFSVFSRGPNGKASGERKASLEIVEIVGGHLSKCRITEITDRRNPVTSGDVLYNPAWNPSLREHIAIAGIIYLTDDRRNNTEEFMRNLEKQGTIIDAWQDPKDGSLQKGDLRLDANGISLNTSYLILGEMPLEDKEGKWRLTYGDLRRQATELGVTLVRYRDFLALVGYPLPKNAEFANKADYGEFVRPGVRPTAPALDKIKPPEINGKMMEKGMMEKGMEKMEKDGKMEEKER